MALIILDRPNIFSCEKSVNQVLTTSFADVVTWDVPKRIDDIFSFNATTGVLTINKSGDFVFSYAGFCQATTSDRGTVSAQLIEEGSVINNSFRDSQYAVRLSTTHNVGTMQVNAALRSVVAGNEYKWQVAREGAAITQLYGKIHVYEAK